MADMTPDQLAAIAARNAKPERTWIDWPQPNATGLAFSCQARPPALRTEYVRADLFAAEIIRLTVKLAELTVALAEAEKWEGCGIYAASKTVHAPMWKRHRNLGAPIISTWLDEAGVGETADFADLWRRCISEASSCEALIAYREPGEILKGAFIEIGAALANDRKVYCVGDFEGMSFINHPLVTVAPDVATAIRAMTEAANAE